MAIDLDLLMRHELFLDRKASEGINTHISPSLRAAFLQIRRDLLDAELNTPAQLRRVEKYVETAVLTNDGWEGLTLDMESVAVNEAAFQAAAISKMAATPLKTPAEKQIKSLIDAAFMSLEGPRPQVGKWAEFVAGAKSSQISQINTVIRQGYQRGDTTQKIVKEIRGLYNDVLAKDAESLARTGYAHYQAQASAAMAEAQDIDMEYYYSAVFDNRTTAGCMSLDGTRWPLDSPNIVYTPRHFNCRSRLLTVPKGEPVTGTKAAVGGKGTKDAADKFAERDARRRKASQVRRRGNKDDDVFDAGQISAKTSFDQWLGKQPDYFIDDTLGPTRAKLFKEGGLSLDKFTDMRGNELTLKELRARDADAFKRAGL